MLNLSIKIAKILTYSTLSNCGVVSNKRTGCQKTPSNCWSHQIGGYLVKMKSIAAILHKLWKFLTSQRVFWGLNSGFFSATFLGILSISKHWLGSSAVFNTVKFLIKLSENYQKFIRSLSEVYQKFNRNLSENYQITS